MEGEREGWEREREGGGRDWVEKRVGVEIGWRERG